MTRFRQMLKTTAVRLTLVYSLIFGLLAVGVVYYIGFNTSRLLLNQFRVTVDQEVNEIARITRRGGIRRLVPLVERRSRRPGANLYLIADLSGRVIAGNVRQLETGVLEQDGWRIPPFSYLGFDREQEPSMAIARVFTLPGDLKLLVGRDIGDAQNFRVIVRRASAIALLALVLTGVLLWFFIGRRALRHIDSVSESSDRIIAGDLSQRLPLSGSGDEFDRLSASLNSLLERVEKLNTGVTTMSDSIAHDLKTPLTRLRNRADAALSDAGSDPKAALSTIIDDADGMIKTFDALLMISQVNSGARSANLSPVELLPIVENVHELFEPSAEDMGATLTLQAKENAVVNGNRELLAQALTNLLDNAFKYGGGNAFPQFGISLDKQLNDVVLSVVDNGNGIESGDQERVLERFTRLEKSRNQPGSGLGLSLVKAVVDLHGGKLQLEDAAPGLRVKIILPMRK